MNTSAEVTLRFGDGHHTFALKLKWIDELQRSVARSLGHDLAAIYGCGLGDIAGRLSTGRFLSADIVETIRCGLVGGGMTAPKALQLIETYVDGYPLADPDDPESPLNMARAIISAALFGVSEVGKKDGDAPQGNADAATADTSTLRPSTEKDLPSDFPLQKSDG